MVDNTSLILSIDSTQSLGIICTPHRHGSETRSRGNRIEPTPTLIEKNRVDRVRGRIQVFPDNPKQGQGQVWDY